MLSQNRSIILIIGTFTVVFIMLVGIEWLNQTAQAQTAVTAPTTNPTPADIFHHLTDQQSLYWVVDGDSHNAGALVNPATEAYTLTHAYALRERPVVIFQTAVTNTNGESIAWESADMVDRFNLDWQNALVPTVITETQVTTATLTPDHVLLVPSFSAGHEVDVVDALGADGLNAIAEFVNHGGAVYAQGNGAYLLEAAGVVATGTVDLNNPLQLPIGDDDQGYLVVDDPTHPLTFNWQSQQLWLLDDPALTATSPLTTVARYSNTLGGPQPAILYGEVGQGRVILVSGHATSALFPQQHQLFVNGLLLGMAERAELAGSATQTYDGNVPPNLIPAYEEGITITAQLDYTHLWQGRTINNVTISETIGYGFTVLTDSIQPPPTSLTLITNTAGVTETHLLWQLGDLPAGTFTVTYQALTQLDALAPGQRTFSTGYASYSDGTRAVEWHHPDFTLQATLAARLEGEHDNEWDRLFTFLDGVYTDEFIYLENKEHSLASDVRVGRYIPIIVPIVGLEDQREPLATNAGETVWVKNEFFVYDFPGYTLPVGMSSVTETWGIDQWDGQTFVTMHTPGGYHIDPIQPRNTNPGFFVTIPSTYTHMITVTSDYALQLPAIYVEWELGDFPGYWYELPAVRYGIHSTELFDRPVSFTGDPFVDTVVVDATGGSIYTGSGRDPLIYRDQLAEVEVHPPQPPTTATLSYTDVWSRTHTAPLRASFYDVFNFASCGCGPGNITERHAAINVTFEIWVDTDGDGIKETSIVDFAEMKGILPTRLEADVDIFIKSRNLMEDPIGFDENLIDGSIFRGLGYTIEPRYGEWLDSYTSDYSTLITTTREGGYDHLYFQQEMPVGQTDLIVLHASLDANNRPIEGMMKLHDGVQFVYRQQFAGEGQYEVNATHVQNTVGARSDARVTDHTWPGQVSTYSDTIFTTYEIWDRYDSRLFNEDPYQTSWGYGCFAATTYVGGRDGRQLLHSLLTANDRTWVRVELNNNCGYTINNVQLGLDAPAGLSSQRIFNDVDDTPLPLWPDLPFMNLTDIPDAGFAVYFFELTSSEAITDLLGTVQAIPVTFSADNTSYELPPATVAFRQADGTPPRWSYGTSHDLQISDSLPNYVALHDMRLLNDAEIDLLHQAVLSDTADPADQSTYALDYFHSLSHTIPYSTSNGTFTADIPVTLPWQIADGESRVHLVTMQTISVTTAQRYAVNAGGVLDSIDSFGLPQQTSNEANFVMARGAALSTIYSTDTITRLLTGEPLGYLTINEDNLATVVLTTTNGGTDVAVDSSVFISLSHNVTPTLLPSNVLTTSDGGLLWQIGDLAPGNSRSTTIQLQVFGDAGQSSLMPLAPVLWGDLAVIQQADATFINARSNRLINTQTGDHHTMPYGHDSPPAPSVTFDIMIDADGDGVHETSIAEWNGRYPTHYTGDVVIRIKNYVVTAQNQTLTIPVYRGDGYNLIPSYGTWANSFTAAHSTLHSIQDENGFDVLTFQQSLPAQTMEQITLYAQLDATNYEGRIQLHDGVHFGEDTTLVSAQSVWGMKSDLQTMPLTLSNAASTYGDTFLTGYALTDEGLFLSYDETIHEQTATTGRASATTRTGDGQASSSLITLGETTMVRVILHNNESRAWQNIRLIPDTLSGLTVNEVATTAVADEAPYLNARGIAPAGLGIYYFEIETSASQTDWLGQVIELPFTLQGDNLPEDLTIPSAVLGIRHADGSLPTYRSDEAQNVTIQQELGHDVAIEHIYQLSAEAFATLQQYINQDEASYPHGTAAMAYLALQPTIPFDIHGDDQLTIQLNPSWTTNDTLYLVTKHQLTSLAPSWHEIYGVGLHKYDDSFALSHDQPLLSQYLPVRGPLLDFFASANITRLETGETQSVFYTDEAHRVTLTLRMVNEGNETAVSPNRFFPLTVPVTWVSYPDSIIPTEDGFWWQPEDIPAQELTTVELVWEMTAPSNASNLTLVSEGEVSLVNAYNGHSREAWWHASVTRQLVVPPIYETYLPFIAQASAPEPNPLPDLVVENIDIIDGSIQVTIANIGEANVTDDFWVDLYVNPDPAPVGVNEIWHDGLSDYGAAWGVTGGLASGASLTLTLGDNFYFEEHSQLPETLTAGTVLYAQVDSLNLDSPYGAVIEKDEANGESYNNITSLTLTNTVPLSQTTSTQATSEMRLLPIR